MADDRSYYDNLMIFNSAKNILHYINMKSIIERSEIGNSEHTE